MARAGCCWFCFFTLFHSHAENEHMNNTRRTKKVNQRKEGGGNGWGTKKTHNDEYIRNTSVGEFDKKKNVQMRGIRKRGRKISRTRDIGIKIEEKVSCSRYSYWQSDRIQDSCKSTNRTRGSHRNANDFMKTSKYSPLPLEPLLNLRLHSSVRDQNHPRYPPRCR